MPVAPSTLNRALSCLSRVAPVTYRRIFDGVGLYCQGQLFAVLAAENLYFRTDPASVQPYRDRAMPALQPPAIGATESHFYQLPETVLENAPELVYWMRAAVEASQPLQTLTPLSECREVSPPPYCSVG